MSLTNNSLNQINTVSGGTEYNEPIVIENRIKPNRIMFTIVGILALYVIYKVLAKNKN